VPGGRDVDGHAVVGQQVGGLADAVPVVQPEGEVVQRAVRPGDDGDVVRGVRPLQPGGELVAVVGDDLLGEPELQHVTEERGDAVDVLGHDEDVVQPGRRDADQVGRAGRRVGQRQHVADLLHAVDQLDQVARGGLEPDGLAPARAEFGRGEALDGDPGLLHPGGVIVEVVLFCDLERHVVQAVGGRLAQHHRVVLVLVPALQEHPALFVGDLDEADHLGVVGRAQLQVGNPDLDVLQAQDAVAQWLLLMCGTAGSAG
jgi:hypothetical protein